MLQETNTCLNENLLLCQEEIVKLRKNFKVCEEMVVGIQKDSGRMTRNDWRKSISERVLVIDKLRAEREQMRKETQMLGDKMESADQTVREYMTDLQDDVRYLQDLMKMDGVVMDTEEDGRQEPIQWVTANGDGKQHIGDGVIVSKRVGTVGRCKLFGLDKGMDRILICERLVRLGRCKMEEIELGQFLPTRSGTCMAYVTTSQETIRRVCCYRQFEIGRKRLSVREVVKENSRCSRCWELGHWSRECTSDLDKSNRCFYCGKRGHRIVDCRYRIQRTVGTEKDRKITERMGDATSR